MSRTPSRPVSPTRRGLLAGAGALLGASLLPPPRIAWGRAGVDQRLLVVLLRGGLDGLAAVPPWGDPSYRRMRGELALSGPDTLGGVIDLDGFFGLHPAMQSLMPLWERDELLPLHAVATPSRSRSHFEVQDVLEQGGARQNQYRDGWLNRTLGVLPEADEPLGLALAANTPLILRGPTTVSTIDPRGRVPDGDWFTDQLAGLYREDPLLAAALAEGLRGRQRLQATLSEEDLRASRGARGAAGALRAIQAVAGLLAAPDGARLAVVELGGWDTHARQGAGEGQLARQLESLATGLAALPEALGSAWRKTAVLVVTEFGRTVRPNGTGGTDHGTGSAALLLGGAVAGGRVLSDWPGLSASALHEGRDLRPTTSLQGIFGGVLTQHLGLSTSELRSRVFPQGIDGTAPRDLFRG